MHNQLQDLRGSVRVFVRTRPFLPGDNETPPPPGAHAAVRCSSDAVTVVAPGGSSSSGGGGAAQSFVFDRVFAPSAGQEDVFREVSEFVQSALDGYKVCLFSYGQTGSGKTWTLQGSGRGSLRGITPRAVEQILLSVRALRERHWHYDLEVSFMEIYNEQVRGGGHRPSAAAPLPRARAGAAPAKLSIKRGADGGMEVAGLSRHAVDMEDQERGLRQLEVLMAMAQRTRSTARTEMNAQSSRSHSIFTLWLKGTSQETRTTLRGVLHLVDLAGSERLDRSGAARDAQQLRETQAINKSLSCLADVFAALGSKASHTPFRNSKLTYLLQDCLSGEGKALMMVNLSPTAASVPETLCSLRFAGQVSQVELGKATRQVSFRAQSSTK
ncbi:kinesin family-like protein [Tribonema minus]|uniref:Kinesin-like protein n=1 Tax=Tribonema minus TaxID=303371 RepID=A0A836CD03_9STRA|nr:kinesin family-like protein [Tribonema minus]